MRRKYKKSKKDCFIFRTLARNYLIIMIKIRVRSTASPQKRRIRFQYKNTINIYRPLFIGKQTVFIYIYIMSCKDSSEFPRTDSYHTI